MTPHPCQGLLRQRRLRVDRALTPLLSRFACCPPGFGPTGGRHRLPPLRPRGAKCPGGRSRKGKAAEGLSSLPAETPAQGMAQTFFREMGDLYSKTGPLPKRTEFSVYFIGKTPKRYPKGSVNKEIFPFAEAGELGNVPRESQESEKPDRRFPRLGKDRLGSGALCMPKYLERRQSRQAQIAA